MEEVEEVEEVGEVGEVEEVGEVKDVGNPPFTAGPGMATGHECPERQNRG